MSKALPLLQIKHLSRPTFGPVTLDVNSGDCVCISGPSGTGKSQLLRAIAELDPADGELLLGGVPSHSMTPAGWRTRVGLLPPESSWWFDTPGAHFHNGMRVPLGQVGLDGAILEQAVRRLSSGEKQRLALLRLLANEPRVLLLDEPTANLDPENTRRVESVIDDYRRTHKAAVLWVSHDRQQVERVANRCLAFSQNDIREHPVGSRQ